MKRLALLALLTFLAGAVAIATVLAVAAAPRAQTQPTPTAVASAGTFIPTQVQVFVLSRGGKFIGDDIGGAEVTLRDARTGEFLASGRTHGGSGRDDLMTVERARTEPLSRQDAAVFTTTLSIDAPRLVEFEAYGPLAGQGSANRVTATEWVLPSDFVDNDIVLEIPGLNVAILNPPTHFMPKTKPPLEIPLRVNVTMMCGCPIAPAYPWKPENYRVRALIVQPDGAMENVDLQFDAHAPDDAPSQFIGSFTATQSGIYRIRAMARQVSEDNAGSDEITIIVP